MRGAARHYFVGAITIEALNLFREGQVADIYVKRKEATGGGAIRSRAGIEAKVASTVSRPRR